MTDTNIDQEIIVPLSKRVEDYSNRLIEVETAQTSLDLLQAQINDFVAEQFPQLAELQDRLSEANMQLQESRALLEQKAMDVDPQALTAQYGRAVVVKHIQSVTHFDTDKALQYIRSNRIKAERLGLVKIKTNKSDWQKAIANGADLPDDIASIETVKSVAVSGKEIKKFATG
jgi:SMC interacting uncharacterized protein involved in chromosome segregation